MTLNGGILFDKSGTRVEVKDIKCNLAEPIKEKDAFIFILLFFKVVLNYYILGEEKMAEINIFSKDHPKKISSPKI